MAKALYDEKKIPEALFQYARAAQFDGPGALPPATRTQLLDFFNKAYKGYKGNAEGADQLLAQAKTAALPPDGFTIASASDAAKKEADAMQSTDQIPIRRSSSGTPSRATWWGPGGQLFHEFG